MIVLRSQKFTVKIERRLVQRAESIGGGDDFLKLARAKAAYEPRQSANRVAGMDRERAIRVGQPAGNLPDHAGGRHWAAAVDGDQATVTERSAAARLEGIDHHDISTLALQAQGDRHAHHAGADDADGLVFHILLRQCPSR